MKGFVSDHAVASHGEQTIASRGECFRAERRRWGDWPPVAFIRRTRDLPLGLQLGPQDLGLFSRFVSEGGQTCLGYGETRLAHFSFNR
jgi:hypothetical protein